MFLPRRRRPNWPGKILLHSAICNLYARIAVRPSDPGRTHRRPSGKYHALFCFGEPSESLDRQMIRPPFCSRSRSTGGAARCPRGFRPVPGQHDSHRVPAEPDLSLQYLFYCGSGGAFEDEAIAGAPGSSQKSDHFLKLLGSYPRKDPRHPLRLDKEQVRSLSTQLPRLPQEARA